VAWHAPEPQQSGAAVYREDDLLRNATELGQEALLQLLSGHFQSTDPDLRGRKDPAYPESLQALQTFVFRHSPQLLADIFIVRL
jgi:hypothetical protein